MDIHQFEVVVSHHAFLRAFERSVTPDMIESTIKGGRQKRFGKHFIAFTKEYKSFTVICIGEICGMIIKIKTIETKP